MVAFEGNGFNGPKSFEGIGSCLDNDRTRALLKSRRRYSICVEGALDGTVLNRSRGIISI